MTFDAHALFCEVIRVYDGTKIRASCGGTNCSYNGCRAIQRAFAGLAARSPAPATGDAGTPRVPQAEDVWSQYHGQWEYRIEWNPMFAPNWMGHNVARPGSPSVVLLAGWFTDGTLTFVRSSEPAPRTNEAPSKWTCIVKLPHQGAPCGVCGSCLKAKGEAPASKGKP